MLILSLAIPSTPYWLGYRVSYYPSCCASLGFGVVGNLCTVWGIISGVTGSSIGVNRAVGGSAR